MKFNIAHRIVEMANKFPDKKAVVFSERQRDESYLYSSYTFKEFEERSNQMANQLIKYGVRPHMRTLVFVRPCLDFSVITFALFKIGAIPVMIDPGMGLKSLLGCIRKIRAEGMIAVGSAHWLRRIKWSAFSKVKVKVSLQRVGGRTHYLYHRLQLQSKKFNPFEVRSHDLSAILFTSGGTGIPKGVLYTHGILNAQTEALRSLFNLDQNQIDVAAFPLFALFTLAMGMTSVVPDMDPTKPAQCDPARIVKNILDNGATFIAGSPAIWERVGNYCLLNRIKLTSVKYVVMFGAPVRSEIHELYKNILPNGDTYTPYGATECLPVSLISGSEILSSKVEQMRQGEGTCIGKAVPGTIIKIMKVSDIPETHLREMPLGECGEIVVSGQQVTPSYFDLEEETRKTKIFSEGRLWHRMGDIGYFDNERNLWFLGRKAHRVRVDQMVTHYPMRVESIFNQHPAIKRSALISLTKKQSTTPGLAIERHDGQTKLDEEFELELKALAQSSRYTNMIKEFFLHPGFPVDVRHNIKIDRIKLSKWANKKR